MCLLDECVDHLTADHSPETNAIVEGLDGTPRYEHLYPRDIADVVDLRAAVDDFVRIYNEVRPHESLGFRTSAQCLSGRPAATPIRSRRRVQDS